MNLPEELQFIQNSFKIQKTTNARLDGKVCVITGATSGVGYEAAKQLAIGGAKIIIVCRNKEKALLMREEFKTISNQKFDFFLADFTKLDTVYSAAKKINDKYPHIDILINNAGIFNKRRVLTEHGLEMVFQVNHIASFLFTQQLIDKMKKSAPSRIIQVNSEGHRFGWLNINDLNWQKRPYYGLFGYGAAKVAQLLTVWEFSDHLTNTGTTINAMHPGAVRTKIGMNNGFLYRTYNRYLLRWFLKDPVLSGKAIYYLAAAPEMIGISGKYFHLTHEEQPAPHALDRSLGRQVWKISENIINQILENKNLL